MNRRVVQRCTGMLLCIIKNQVVMMEVMQKLLETYPHTARYGTDYMNKLQDRMDICERKYGKNQGDLVS